MKLSKLARREVARILAQSGMHPTEASLMRVAIVIAAVDLQGAEAIPGLKVKVTDKAALRAHLVKLAGGAA